MTTTEDGRQPKLAGLEDLSRYDNTVQKLSDRELVDSLDLHVTQSRSLAYLAALGVELASRLREEL